MQKRMSFIGRSTLLPVVLLTTVLQCGAVTGELSTVAKMHQDQSAGHGGSGNHNPVIARPAGWSIGSTPSGVTQLLAQNQQAPASAQEQSPPSAEEKPDLDDQVIRDVFGPLQRGMEGHNIEQVLAIFDQQQMTDYAQVRDQLRAFFDQYDAIRFRYQLLQVTSDRNHGSATAEIEMEATPADPSQVTLRRDTQMRFHLNLGGKGWRLVGFAPADFFAQ
jgi:hypothetical protein